MMDETHFVEAEYSAVRKSMRARRTWKVLADPNSLQNEDEDVLRQNDNLVRDAVCESGWAPFHYDRKADGIPEPWRFYFIDQATCRKIAANIFNWFDDVKPNNKIPAMLSACGSLVLVNWLPQTGRDLDESAEKLRQINEEHLAATSAAVQNLLLLLTARNLGTYWSSGGLFRDARMCEKIGIDSNERLLGAIFVDYSPSSEHERIPGKLRDQRSSPEKWMREIQI